MRASTAGTNSESGSPTRAGTASTSYSAGGSGALRSFFSCFGGTKDSASVDDNGIHEGRSNSPIPFLPDLEAGEGNITAEFDIGPDGEKKKKKKKKKKMARGGRGG